MSTVYKNSIGILIVAVSFFVTASFAHADDLDVVFEFEPLFQNANIIPGDDTSRTVTVTNTGEETEDVRVSVKNVFNNGLADVMELTITSNAGTHYDGYFDEFFDAVPVGLDTLASAESRVYTFTASLDAAVGNEYQLTTMGFDLCIGFSGTEIVCEGNGDDDDEDGGGGGGGSHLRISNETVESDEGEQPVVLSWKTNRSATTYLVCGNETENNGPFVLDAGEQFFGYEFDVEEDDDLKTVHSVELSELTAGQYECVPAARRDTNDGFTTGKELRFAIPPEGEVLGEEFEGGMGGAFIPEERIGSVRGAHTSDEVTVDGTAASSDERDRADEILGDHMDRTVSAAAIMWDEEFCTLWWLLLLVLISFGWSVYDDKYRNKLASFNDLFIRNAIFSIVYVIAILIFHFTGLLDIFWWLLAGAWAIMVGLDYREHRLLQTTRELMHRVIYFAAAGAFFIITALLFDFPCVWWPFFLILTGAGIVYFFDLYDRD